jgi:hypothetical protein
VADRAVPRRSGAVGRWVGRAEGAEPQRAQRPLDQVRRPLRTPAHVQRALVGTGGWRRAAAQCEGHPRAEPDTDIAIVHAGFAAVAILTGVADEVTSAGSRGAMADSLARAGTSPDECASSARGGRRPFGELGGSPLLARSRCGCEGSGSTFDRSRFTCTSGLGVAVLVRSPHTVDQTSRSAPPAEQQQLGELDS